VNGKSEDRPDLLVEDVHKSYEAGAAVLKGVTLALSRGETSAVVGPSGSGKSTLLNIIGSLDRPSSGRVELGGVDVTSLKDSELPKYRARSVGFVFQDHHLLPQCNVLENTLLPALALGKVESAACDRARALLGRVGLGGRERDFPSRLSGGERQRVAVARALLNEPRLLLCDEPTGSLDRDTAEEVVSLFLDLVRESRAMMILVTHNMELAGRMSRIWRLQDGVLASVRLGPQGEPWRV